MLIFYRNKSKSCLYAKILTLIPLTDSLCIFRHFCPEIVFFLLFMDPDVTHYPFLHQVQMMSCSQMATNSLNFGVHLLQSQVMQPQCICLVLGLCTSSTLSDLKVNLSGPLMKEHRTLKMQNVPTVTHTKLLFMEFVCNMCSSKKNSRSDVLYNCFIYCSVIGNGQIKCV